MQGGNIYAVAKLKTYSRGTAPVHEILEQRKTE